MAAQHLTITRLDKHFGSFQALTDVNLNIEKGEFCALLGPSGCGKSTLLRLIAGLEEVTAGQIHIAGKEVTHLEPSQRKIAMVFQSYALYPHMTVAENIAFSLEVMGIPKNQRLQKAKEIADLLQLTLLLERRPAALSGGQRQRVAIGRALVREPEVFLFDEPLSNLDALLRVQMRIELINLHRKIGATMVYVTHDQIEAMTMADKIVVMNQGVIQQIGAPMALYNQPANRFVAGFVGSPSMNFLAARVERQYENQTALRIGEQVLDLGYTIAAPEGQSLTLGIRAEDCQSGGTLFNGMVKLVERLGSQTLCHLETALGDICIQDVGNSMVRLGDTLPFDLNMARAHLFSHSGERLLTN